jgi:hypothetical protein
MGIAGLDAMRSFGVPGRYLRSYPVPIWTDIAESTSSKVRELHHWWATNRGACGLPDRRDFDATMFPQLLPNLLITDVEPTPFRIRYRLVGTKVSDILNINITGRYLDDLIDGATNTPWMDYFASAYEGRQAIMGRVVETTTAGGKFTFEFGMFPVTAGSAEIRQFISIEDYFDFHLTSAELIPWAVRQRAS